MLSYGLRECNVEQGERKITATAQKPHTTITLFENDIEQRLQFVCDDHDRFIVTIKEAIDACRANSDQLGFKVQFEDLLAFLSTWLESRHGQIRSAKVTIRETDLLFVVMQKHVPFDQKLSEDLTVLDIEVANAARFNLIRLNVLAIPAVSEASASAFLSSGQVLAYAK